MKHIVAGVLGLLFGIPLVGFFVWAMAHGQASLNFISIVGSAILSLIPIVGARLIVLELRDRRAAKASGSTSNRT